MIKKIKNIIAVVAAPAVFSVPVLVPAMASAQDDQITPYLCGGTNLDVSNSQCEDPSVSSDKINNIIRLVINIFSLIVGVVSVIMIIVGGLKYITSGGESSNISSAKNTIIYAIIGLVIVALAQFIVHFVLGKITVGQ